MNFGNKDLFAATIKEQPALLYPAIIHNKRCVLRQIAADIIEPVISYLFRFPIVDQKSRVIPGFSRGLSDKLPGEGMCKILEGGSRMRGYSCRGVLLRGLLRCPRRGTPGL